MLARLLIDLGCACLEIVPALKRRSALCQAAHPQEQPMRNRHQWRPRAWCGAANILVLLAVMLVSACGSAPAKTFTVGVINLSPRLEPVLNGFKARMLELGYQEGQNITYIYQGPASNIAELDSIARGLVAARVDLILALSTPATQATQRATAGTSLPVVFAPVTDPVAAGIVTDLRRPGGNITGVALGGDSEARRLEWLLKLAPQARRIYVPYNPDDASARSSLAAIRGAALKLNVELQPREARNTTEITAAFTGIPTDTQAVVLLQDSLVAARTDDFVKATIARRLPLSVPTDEQVQRGALVAFSAHLAALGAQTARLADRIFHGGQPADMPIETAEFFLTINLRTAKTIGLDIPDTYLREADEIVR
jgi:putative tryptophan/tyrosine transport system substrate-binding protein